MESKWDMLFDKNPEDWIFFKPRIGLFVYACYACRHMFSSKATFLDHVNRRAVLLKYNCRECTTNSTPLTFYNRCALLLHNRSHFSMVEGKLHLSDVEVSSLPMGMAGFSPLPNIPMLYDVQDDIIDKDMYINAQFYSPDFDERGKDCVVLKPRKYAYYYKDTDRSVNLTLKQVSSTIPRCEFVCMGDQQVLFDSCRERNGAEQISNSSVNGSVEELNENSTISVVKAEPEELMDSADFTLPVISKIESISDDAPRCLECHLVPEGTMTEHFLGENRPMTDTLNCRVCKFVASTKCSLNAHKRFHDSSPPYVCPDCGKNFDHSELLRLHMEDSCFHLAKHVRFRCPGKKCGKLFALTSTYAAHFATHIQCLSQCTVCKNVFFKEGDFTEHAAKGNGNCKLTKIFNCTVCKNVIGGLTEATYKSHVHWHTTDTNRCMYVYLCRHCRSYFRSTTTYAMHMQKCSKVSTHPATPKKAVDILRYITGTCRACKQVLVYREDNPVKICTACKDAGRKIEAPKQKPVMVKPVVRRKFVCSLCNKEMPVNDGLHLRQCKYWRSKVVLQKLDVDCTNWKVQDDGAKNSATSETELLSSPDKAGDSPRNDDNKKKRKRVVHTPLSKSKKSLSDAKVDLQAEEPIRFDGTYYCKLCEYKNDDRNDFHKHIIVHRDISTVYQCMECAECFVVKPSLVKHLMHYHNIVDCDSYLKENNCYDKTAVKKLEQSMKLVPGESKEPVKENQCRVCREEFTDPTELNKHFRVHGMAFLLRNTK